MFGSHGPKKSGQGKTRYRVKLDLGKSMVGWLVGPIIGLETHYLNTTRPCRRDVTHGRMVCYCTRMKLESVWKGYVPLIDRDGVHCFVQICSTYAELAYKAQVFAPVKVTRMTHRGAPYCVKHDAWSEIDPRSHFDIKRPVDIKEWLLKLWNDEELTEWVKAHPEAATEAEASKLAVEEFSPMNRAAAAKANADNRLPNTIGDVLPHVVGRNGKAVK